MRDAEDADVNIRATCICISAISTLELEVGGVGVGKKILTVSNKCPFGSSIDVGRPPAHLLFK